MTTNGSVPKNNHCFENGFHGAGIQRKVEMILLTPMPNLMPQKINSTILKFEFLISKIDEKSE